MAELLTGFPDSEDVVTTILASLGDAVTETEADFLPPAIRVQRTGGPCDGITDYPVIEVTYYGASRKAARAMSESGTQLVLSAAHTAVAGSLIDSSFVVNGAQQMPDPRDDLRAITKTYQLSFRRSRI